MLSAIFHLSSCLSAQLSFFPNNPSPSQKNQFISTSNWPIFLITSPQCLVSASLVRARTAKATTVPQHSSAYPLPAFSLFRTRTDRYFAQTPYSRKPHASKISRETLNLPRNANPRNCLSEQITITPPRPRNQISAQKRDGLAENIIF